MPDCDTNSKATASDFKLFRRVLREAKPHYAGFCLVFFVSLLATPVALLTPVPLKIAVDSGLGDTPLPAVLRTVLPVSLTDSQSAIITLSAILVIIVMLLTQLQWMASTILRTVISDWMVLDFRAKLFRQVQRLSFSFHDQKGSADSIYRIQWDANAIKHLTIDGMIPFITSLFTLVAMVSITFALDWQLGLVALTVAPILIGVAQFYRPRLRERAKKSKQVASSAFSVIPETLGALRVVKAFGQEDREQARFEDHSRASLKAKLHYMVYECGLAITVGLTTASGTALVLLVGAQHVQSGQLSLGELLLVMSYIGQLYGPLKSLSNKVATMQSHLASAERVFALLDEPTDVVERSKAVPLDRARGHFYLDHVSFNYPGNPEILSDVNLEVEAGTRIGIAGRTGAGKTTFVSLLMRFYDVAGGGIYLDGVDIRDIQLTDLRKQFAIVLQDPVLFSTSIAENIAYGKSEAGEDEIIAAAKAANAHDFILKLPDGYNTLVGERGMRLSGGERQRISLARAFLKDAPILILDEPTSSVDTQTEVGIMEAMSRLIEGRTTFMIAHRLSTLEMCDVTYRIGDANVNRQETIRESAVTIK